MVTKTSPTGPEDAGAPGDDAASANDASLSLEKEYERFNPGGGPPGQQEERDKKNPRTTRDDGGAEIPGSQNEDLKGPKPDRGPKGAST